MMIMTLGQLIVHQPGIVDVCWYYCDDLATVAYRRFAEILLSFQAPWR